MPLVSHGYPDFNRVISQADVTLLHEVNVLINASTDKPLGFVGQLPYIGISFQSLGGAFRVWAAFYAEATYSTLLGVFAFDVSASGVFGGSVPIEGPFCKLTLFPAAAGQHYSIDVWSSPAEFCSFVAQPDDNVLLSASGQSIGAGANTTFAATRTFPAESVLCVSTTAVSWVGHIFGTDYQGNLKHIQFFTPGVTQYNQLVYLPAMPVSLNLKNNDTGVKLFDFSLIARPWSPGR